MALAKTLALVVRFRPYRETSILFTAATPEHGTLHFLGKGFREAHKGFMGLFESLTLLDIVFYERNRSQLQLLKEVNEIEHFPHLRRDAQRYALGCHFADIVDQLAFGGGDEETNVFKLLIESLRRIGDPAVDSERLSEVFKMHILVMAGFTPQLYRCVSCGEEDLSRGRFAYEQGGAVCFKCSVRIGGTLPLSPDALRALRFLSRESFEKSLRLETDPKTGLELKRLLDRFISYRLEGDLRTRRVLAQLGLDGTKITR